MLEYSLLPHSLWGIEDTQYTYNPKLCNLKTSSTIIVNDYSKDYAAFTQSANERFQLDDQLMSALEYLQNNIKNNINAGSIDSSICFAESNDVHAHLYPINSKLMDCVGPDDINNLNNIPAITEDTKYDKYAIDATGNLFRKLNL